MRNPDSRIAGVFVPEDIFRNRIDDSFQTSEFDTSIVTRIATRVVTIISAIIVLLVGLAVYVLRRRAKQRSGALPENLPID